MTHDLNTRVRIAHHRCRYDGYVGTVAEINPDNQFPYGVSGLEDWLLWFGDGELVHVETDVVVA